ncbi:MAG: hypothetical protein ACLR23_26430 [Clostridia bacterium]
MDGSVDLSQAEAVMDLISSQTDLSLRSSIHTLKRRLTRGED